MWRTTGVASGARAGDNPRTLSETAQAAGRWLDVMRAVNLAVCRRSGGLRTRVASRKSFDFAPGGVNEYVHSALYV